MPKVVPVLHDVKDVATMFKISTRTVANLVKRGDIVPTRIGDRLLFHPDEVNRFAREGVKSSAPVNRTELDAFIDALAPASKLAPLLKLYRSHLDGQAVLDAGEIRGLLADFDETLTEATGRTLGIRFLGNALAAFDSTLSGSENE
jgi:Helix-turn-helix domain